LFKDTNETLRCDTCHFSYISDEIRNLDGSKLSESLLDKQYLAIIYWATFMGRLNRDYTIPWNKQLAKYEDVHVINVSLDVREFWPSATN
jgi:hypothetical protein